MTSTLAGISLFSCASLPGPSPLEGEDPSIAKITEPLPPEVYRAADPAAYYHFIKAYTHEFYNDEEAALREYKAALSYDKNSLVLLSRLGNLASKMDHYEEAKSYAEAVLLLIPDHVPTLTLLASLDAKTNQFNRAIELYEKVIQLQPEHAEGYLNLGVLYASMDRFDDAEQVIKRGISKLPGSPIGYYYLGRIASDSKKYEKALGYLKKAISISPDFEPAYLGIGTVYELQGKNKEAVKAYQKILDEVNPRNRSVMGRLVEIYIKERPNRSLIEQIVGTDRNVST